MTVSAIAQDEDQIIIRSDLFRPIDLIQEACARVPCNLTHAEWQQYLPGEPYRNTCSNLPDGS